MYSSPKQALN